MNYLTTLSDISMQNSNATQKMAENSDEMNNTLNDNCITVVPLIFINKEIQKTQNNIYLEKFFKKVIKTL